MKLLLDTCTFFWLISDEAALSSRARALLTDPTNPAYLSSVSAWEIAVKAALGRLQLSGPPYALVPRERERHRIQPLSLEEHAVLHISKLPDLHPDPFDRMLVCQAVVNGMTPLTPDALIQRYPVVTDW